MQTVKEETITTQRLAGLFEENRKLLFRGDSELLAGIRERAFSSFRQLGFPDTGMESWRLTDLS